MYGSAERIYTVRMISHSLTGEFCGMLGMLYVGKLHVKGSSRIKTKGPNAGVKYNSYCNQQTRSAQLQNALGKYGLLV